MDLQCLTDTLTTMSIASGNNGVSKLTPEQLKLKEVQVPPYFNSRIVKILEESNIKYELKCDRLLVKPSGYASRTHTKCKIQYDREVKEGIPHHCLLAFKYLEDYKMIPVLLESHRLNENIIDDVVSLPLAIASLSVSTDEHEYTCMHVAMNQITLTSLSKPGAKPGQPRFLTTTHVYDCHAVVFWDKNTQTAIMTHFSQTDMCKQSFDFMLSKITQYAPVKDIKAFVVGGINERMRANGNFFDFVEKYLNENNITLKQTFLGDNKRPTDLIFDCKDGIFYELRFLNKGCHKFDVVDDRKDLECSFNNSHYDNTYYYSSENEKHFIPITLNFSPS